MEFLQLSTVANASACSGSFARYAPKIYDYARVTLQALFAAYGWLTHNFANSIFPMVTFNCGPNTVCLEHIDFGNAAHMYCVITAIGTFDATLGGHLVIFSLRKIIEFPSGSTILIPSATLAHGNTPIREGEERFSMTQYCGGGLIRWVEYGFKSAKSLLAEKGGAKKRADIDGPRLSRVLGLFSKCTELAADRVTVFGRPPPST